MKLSIGEFSKHRGMKEFVTYACIGEFSKHLGMKDFITSNRRVEDQKQFLLVFPFYTHMKEFSTKPRRVESCTHIKTLSLILSIL